MIRHIVAIDSQRGMAKESAMPLWHLKQDEAYFGEETKKYGGKVLMGKKTFTEALKNQPLKDRTNYIVTHDSSLIAGATVVNDLAKFLVTWPDHEDLWIIGGSEIFAQTLDIADELYITEIDDNFECDRFYPLYNEKFKLMQASEPHVEHGIRYRFCVYKPRSV